VILAHMYPADQTSWYPTAEKLAEEGYLVLTFDFRGYGESGGEKDIEYLYRDVMAAALEIADAGAEGTALVGASMGGTACLLAAERIILTNAISSQYPPPYETPILGVVTLSAPVEFKGLSVAEDVPMPVCPLLFIAAEDDVGAEGAAALEQLAQNQGDLQIVPGDDHGTDLLKGAESDKVWALLTAFLAENLPGPELPQL
jgi:pimeloyl-ACP methyl ester carboxylesterase